MNEDVRVCILDFDGMSRFEADAALDEAQAAGYALIVTISGGVADVFSKAEFVDVDIVCADEEHPDPREHYDGSALEE